MACSIVSKPASIGHAHRRADARVDAHLRSSRWVSSTAAFSSSWVYSGRVITRWLLISLIQSAPARSCLRDDLADLVHAVRDLALVFEVGDLVAVAAVIVSPAVTVEDARVVT